MHKFFLQKHFIRFEIFLFRRNTYSKTAQWGPSYFVLFTRDSSGDKNKGEWDGWGM